MHSGKGLCQAAASTGRVCWREGYAWGKLRWEQKRLTRPAALTGGRGSCILMASLAASTKNLLGLGTPTQQQNPFVW